MDQFEKRLSMQELIEQHKRAEKALLEDRRKVGVEIESVAYLEWKNQPYPQAIDILIDHFLHDDALDDAMHSAIARCLGVPPMRERWDELVQLCRETTAPMSKEALAFALAAIATKQHYGQLHDLIHDPSLGDVRIAFIRPYVRLGKDKARDDIRPLANDPILGKEVTAVLKGRSANQ